MKQVAACPACGVLSTMPPGSPCQSCKPFGTVSRLEAAGVLLDGLDVGAIVADEGDKLLEEAARALELLEKKGKATHG